MPQSTCRANRYPVSQSSKPSHFVATANGAYVLDTFRNSLSYLSSGGNQDLLFAKSTFPRVQGGAFTRPNDPFFINVRYDEATAQDFFSSYPSLVRPVAPEQARISVRNDLYPYHNGCGQPNATVPNPVGEFYNTHTLNAPASIIQSNDPNILLIASTGSSMIVSYDISTNESSYIDLGLSGYSGPKGLAQDSQGNIYVSTDIGHIYKIDSSGNSTLIAGNASGGFFDIEGNALEMMLNSPYGLAFDSQSNSLFVADSGHHRVVKINLSNGRMETVVGNGTKGFAGDSGPGIDAQLDTPTHLHIDQNRNLLIADSGNNRIRSIQLGSTVGTTLAYSSTSKDHSKLIRNEDGTWERIFRNNQRERFNSEGVHVQTMLPDGLAVVYQYDSGNLTSIRYPNNQQVNFNYSGGRLDSIVDFAGRETSIEHSPEGHLTRVYYPDNSQKQFSYSNAGLLIQESNQKGLISNYVYNEFDRLEKITTAADNSEVQISDAIAKGLERIDGSDGAFIPKNSVSENDGIIDPNGNIVKFVKEFDGSISSITDPLNRTTKIKRDFEGRPVEVTDVDGSITQMAYDQNFGDLIQSTNVSLGISTSKTFNIYGQLTSETDPYGKVTSTIYNSKLLPTQVTGADGKFSTVSYNSLSLPVEKSMFDEDGNLQSKMTFEYDGFGRMTKQTDLNGKFSTYTYDAVGNVISTTSNISGTTSAITQYQYDQMNRLTKVTSPKGEETSYTYSLVGELLTITDPNGKVTQFQYDLKGRVIQKVDPMGSTWSMTYDANGNLLTEADPKGNSKTFSYNSINKVTGIQTSDDLIQYAYNIKDNVVGIQNQTSTINYIRDLKQRITSETVSGVNYPSHTIAYTYTQNDLRTQASSPVQTVNYFYNPYNYQLTGIQNSFGNSFNFNYDSGNRLASIIRPGSQSEFSYDIASTLTSIVHRANGSVKNSFAYQYDDRNFITQKRSPASTSNYSYDENGQLSAKSVVESPSTNEVFQYDSLGNRIAYNGVNSSYDQTGQRIQDDGAYTYLYDLNGNIVSKNSKSNGVSYSFEYSALNQINRIKIMSAPLSSIILKDIYFKYDPAGRRIVKSVVDNFDSTRSYTKKFYYDGDNVFAEADLVDNFTAAYTYSPLRPDDIIAANFSNFAVSAANSGTAISEGQILSDRIGSVYYLKDHLGSITDIISDDGNIIQKYDYSAFGVLREIKDSNDVEVSFDSASIKTSYTFTGREFEPETGLYYYRARYYNPNTGRFLQQDPHPGLLQMPSSFNSKFIYGNNNPILNSDPSGLSWLSDVISGDAARNFGREFDRFIKNPEIQKGIVTVASAIVAYFAAPVLAAAVASSTTGFLIASTLFGAAIGGVVAGAAFQAGGLGTFDDGFWVGARAGAFAGFSGALNYTGTLANGQNISRGVCVGVPTRSVYMCIESPGGNLDNTGFWNLPPIIDDGFFFFHIYDKSPAEFIPPLIPGANNQNSQDRDFMIAFLASRGADEKI